MSECSIKEIIDFLERVPLFSKLDRSSLEKVATHTTVVNYEASDQILNEGDFADALYVIKQGDVRIFTWNVEQQKVILGRFQSGEYFGELALSLVASPRRTASAEAVSKSTFYKIPRKTLLENVSGNKEVSLLLKKRSQDYINDKLTKITQSLGVPLDLHKYLKKTKSFEDREIIYYQGSAADEIFILTYGSVELRHFDNKGLSKNNLKHLDSARQSPVEACVPNEEALPRCEKGDEEDRLSTVAASPNALDYSLTVPNYASDRRTELAVGEIFGAIPLEENQINYQHTAVATSNVEVITVPIEVLQDCIKNVSNFLGILQKLDTRYKFSQYGPTIQFRGQYKDMPTFATLISLKDGREIISQQFINRALTYISLSETLPDQCIKYSQGDFKRDIQLQKKYLVGLYEMGSWDDTDRMLELIVNQEVLSDSDLENFKQTGHFKTEIREKNKTYICQCMRVTKNEIDKVIKSGRCTLEEIKNNTGATSICGACLPSIIDLLGGQSWIPCRLEVTAKHTPLIHTFRLSPLRKTFVSSSPGQYIVIRSNIEGMWVTRSYTLTSPPDSDYFEVTIKLEENGLFSPWLFKNASKNPLIYVSDPHGNFTLDKSNPSIICFAGGIGITPFISFCRYLVKTHSLQSLHIDYSARHSDELLFKEEFENSIKSLKDSSINFRVTSNQERISKTDILKLLMNHPDSDIYICGPTHFELFIKHVLREAGIPSSRVYIEHFLQAGLPATNV